MVAPKNNPSQVGGARKTAAKSVPKTTTKAVQKAATKAVVKESYTQEGLLAFETTKDVPVPKTIMEQVIGQEHAVDVIKKAALQRRHVLLVGDPGTGKSLIGMGLAELLPKEKLVDILAFPNANDENQPLIRTVAAGKGRELVAKAKLDSQSMFKGQNLIFIILAILAMLSPWWIRNHYLETEGAVAANILFAATFLGGLAFVVGIILMLNLNKRGGGTRVQSPKLLVDNFDRQNAPFYDATGAHAGALLGDVLHDPFQSGGLGTPAHERVVSGMIHKAHMGVLFIDEIATLHPTTQQEMLTVLQEGKFSITGQSERSAGAMVRTEPVPCKFILVAAGNLDSIKNIHPALRSRIRGSGYEIYMKDTMLDTIENRNKLVQFVAQEVQKDDKIPHFTRDAVLAIVEEARKRASRKNHLTLRLRELGGFVRSAGDVAKNQGASLVTAEHVKLANEFARGLEKQIADRYIENKKEYDVIVTTGKRVGRVNGLAVLGADGGVPSGIVMPIESQVTVGGREPKVIATGKLGEIAKEAITNITALILRYFGEDIKENNTVFVQFLQTHSGVEGDSASLAVASAIVSAYKNIPIRQDTAITGSVSVRGEALPVGGVSAKVEAAIDAGIKQVIVPRSNLQDIVIDKDRLEKIQIVPVDDIIDALEHLLSWEGNKDILMKIKAQRGK